MQTFGEVISAAIARLGVTQKHVAEQVGVTPAYMNDIMRGRRLPSGSVIEDLAHVLGVNVDYLFYKAGKFPTNAYQNEFGELDEAAFVRKMQTFYKA